MKPEESAITTDVVLDFMFRLGQAYLASGEQTAQVELLLRRTASAYGMRKSRVVAFPTAVFIALHDAGGERVTLARIAGISGGVDVKPQYPTLPKHETPPFLRAARSIPGTSPTTGTGASSSSPPGLRSAPWCCCTA
jgi:hypothetical protein